MVSGGPEVVHRTCTVLGFVCGATPADATVVATTLATAVATTAAAPIDPIHGLCIEISPSFRSSEHRVGCLVSSRSPFGGTDTLPFRGDQSVGPTRGGRLWASDPRQPCARAGRARRLGSAEPAGVAFGGAERSAVGRWPRQRPQGGADLRPPPPLATGPRNDRDRLRRLPAGCGCVRRFR